MKMILSRSEILNGDFLPEHKNFVREKNDAVFVVEFNDVGISVCTKDNVKIKEDD